jgi:hypothetical protein
VSQLKDSMRRTIAEVEQNKKPSRAEAPDSAERPSWSDVFRTRKRS